MVLGRPELDRSVQDHEGAVAAGEALDVEEEGPGDLLPEAHGAFKDLGGSGHAFAGNPGREEAVSGGVSESAAFPHGELAGARLAQSGALHAGDVDGLLELVDVET